MPILLLLSKYCESFIAPLSVPGEVTGPEQTQRPLVPEPVPTSSWNLRVVRGSCTPGENSYPMHAPKVSAPQVTHSTFSLSCHLPLSTLRLPLGIPLPPVSISPSAQDLGQIYAFLVMGETAEEGVRA